MAGNDGYMNKEVSAAPRGHGILDGKVFAVKDVIAIKGHAGSAGNPAWLDTHPPAERHAPVLERLLEQGAALRGTTVTDELMYSLQGENAHYGTPVNPGAAGRIPGGSSSGSASVAAAGLVDFALGTDTGGSVRIPSSYCGLFGFRPTHGAVSIEGVIPLAESFDTVGWMAREARMLLDVGEVLLKGRKQDPDAPPVHKPFQRFLWPDEAWDLAEPELAPVLEKGAGELLAGEAKHWVRLTGAAEGEPGDSLAVWTEVFRQLQGREAWRQHGRWISSVKPVFSPGIGARFDWARGLAPEAEEPYRRRRAAIAGHLHALLGEDGVLVIPTAPGEAPPLSQPVEEAERQRAKTMQLTCIAGLAGLPQVTVPLRSPAGYPVGLSFLAGQNQDLRLLHWLLSRLPLLKGAWVR